MNMKIVKYLAVLLLIICCCNSCKERTEVLHILIQNRTDSIFHVTLYYKGRAHGLKKTLNPNKSGIHVSEETIFVTNDINIAPYDLAVKEFDSIYISTIDNDSIIINFTHENVKGYTENIFSENSSWDFVIVESQLDKPHRSKPMMYNQFRFLILEEKKLH